MKFVTRAQWGARKPTSKTLLPRTDIDTVYIHYTGSDSDEQANHANCASRVLGVQTFHMVHNGWNDIAYSFLVCKHGYVFEGRGFGIRPAATGVDNSHSLAVCFLGDDSANRDDITPAGRDAMVEIVAAIETWARKRLAYKGHRDAMSTNCPGDQIYRYIHSTDFARAVKQHSQPEWYAKALTETPLWAWIRWRDNGQPAAWRPPQIPTKVPQWWWGRYITHKFGSAFGQATSGLTSRVRSG